MRGVMKQIDVTLEEAEILHEAVSLLECEKDPKARCADKVTGLASKVERDLVESR